MSQAAWRAKSWLVTSDARELLSNLYDIERNEARSTIPPKMRTKLRERRRDLANFERQAVGTVASRFVPSEALSFNRVRALTTSMEELYHALSLSHQLELVVVSWTPPIAKVKRRG